MNPPLEYLHSLTPSGLPPHDLKLKIGCVIMLLRNLDTNSGLSNGTSLIVIRVDPNIIHCTILTGVNAGNHVLIPKLPLKATQQDLPIYLRRFQFPVRLAYAVTINKSQGQTYNKVGIYLHKPCFAHGQLYVALSRARAFNDVKVIVNETDQQGVHRGQTFTLNVVEENLLQ